MTVPHAVLLIAITLAAPAALAHPGHAAGDQGQGQDGGDARPAAAHEAGTASTVTIAIRDGFRHVTANGLPDHPTGRFPSRGNPNAIRAQSYAFKVPLKPTPATDRSRAGGRTLFGVALNGVVFDPGTAEFWRNDRRADWNYEAIGGPIDLGLDRNNAHVQPTGAYHYHGLPAGLVESLTRDAKAGRMTLVGWAADGYPVYATFGYADPRDPASGLKAMRPSYRLKDGARPAEPDGPGGKYDGTFTRDYEYVEGLGDLDACNGREGVTPEFPEGTYYYVLTEAFPQVPRQFHGVPDASFRKAGGPGGPGGPRPGRGGPPPPRR
jgi:hypothetical protein